MKYYIYSKELNKKCFTKSTNGLIFIFKKIEDAEFFNSKEDAEKMCKFYNCKTTFQLEVISEEELILKEIIE